MIEAQAIADRSVVEAEGKRKVSEKEAQSHLLMEKAKSDAESYRKIEDAKANQFLFGGAEQYLDYERHKAIAGNSKIYFGALPPTIWSADGMGITKD